MHDLESSACTNVVVLHNHYKPQLLCGVEPGACRPPLRRDNAEDGTGGQVQTEQRSNKDRKRPVTS